MTDVKRSDIYNMLFRVISGEDRSANFVGCLESAIAEFYSEDERFEDILDVLASYRPGGGPFLFDEGRLVTECKAALEIMEDERSSG